MLNWRRDPVVEMQIERSKQRTKQLEKELDLIEADLPSSSTPPPAIAARSSDY